MQDLSWSLHHKQLYSHQNPRPPLNNFILFSTLNLLNKPRAFCHFIYTYIYIYFDLFFPITPSFFVKIVLCWACLSRESVYDPKKQTNKKRESTAWNIQSDNEAHVCSHTHTLTWQTQCERKRSATSREWTHTHVFVWSQVRSPSEAPPKTSTARLCVCELECVFFILVESGGEEGQRVQTKVGFPLVPLNQQQLFGTFNNY